MLLNNFKVSGFKVFGSTVEINMVPQTKNLRSLEENLIINGQKKHIKSSLLYGGNNTGKSSLLDAFKIFKMIVSKGNIDHFPFDILKNFTYGAQNIEFEVSFFDEKKTYTYGIEFNETGSLGEYIFVEEELFLSRERDGFIEGILVENNLKLNPILSEILQSDQVYFEVVHGDLTSNYKEDTSSTIINSIVEIVNSYLTNSNFHVSDLLEVIFIIDMDGAYIKERSIVYQDIEKVIYTNKEILTKHTKELHMRNLVKTGNLDKLSKTAYLTIRNEQINFKIYYMSCNLDHSKKQLCIK